MLARLDDGRIFLESERDIYRKGTGGIEAVRALAQAGKIDDLVDWSRAGEVVNDEEGIARDVTLKPQRAGGPPQIRSRRRQLSQGPKSVPKSQPKYSTDLSRRVFLRTSSLVAAQLDRACGCYGPCAGPDTTSIAQVL
jgi:hypothetical protein